MAGDVRYWHKADINDLRIYVRPWRKADISRADPLAALEAAVVRKELKCPLVALDGHSRRASQCLLSAVMQTS